MATTVQYVPPYGEVSKTRPTKFLAEFSSRVSSTVGSIFDVGSLGSLVVQ